MCQHRIHGMIYNNNNKFSLRISTKLYLSSRVDEDMFFKNNFIHSRINTTKWNFLNVT